MPVTTRSQTLSARLQTHTMSPPSTRRMTRSQTVGIPLRTPSTYMNTRSCVKTPEKEIICSDPPPAPQKTHTHTRHRYNTRSSRKRFIELSSPEQHTRMTTRSMSRFLKNYND